MLKKSVHDFHFVLTQETKKKLTGLDLFKGVKGLSGRIVRILQGLMPVLEREHKWGEQRMSRYMHVSDDPEEVREHVHVYVPGELYRRLKAMHQDLNVYSIAQLVRLFLRFFLCLFGVYGNDVYQKLEQLFNSWNEEEKNVKPNFREFMRQLFRILRHFQGQTVLINIYNRKFSPSWIFRL